MTDTAIIDIHFLIFFSYLPSRVFQVRTPVNRCMQLQLKAVQLTSLYSHYHSKDLANHRLYCAQLTKFYKGHK